MNLVCSHCIPLNVLCNSVMLKISMSCHCFVLVKSSPQWNFIMGCPICCKTVHKHAYKISCHYCKDVYHTKCMSLTEEFRIHARKPAKLVMSSVYWRYVSFLWWRHQMETFFRVTGPLCGEFPGHRWIPHTKASDAELWCFLWSAPE